MERGERECFLVENNSVVRLGNKLLRINRRCCGWPILGQGGRPTESQCEWGKQMTQVMPAFPSKTSRLGRQPNDVRLLLKRARFTPPHKFLLSLLYVNRHAGNQTGLSTDSTDVIRARIPAARRNSYGPAKQLAQPCSSNSQPLHASPRI